MRFLFLLLALLCDMAEVSLWAHGDLHDQIAAVSSEIGIHPTSLLFVKRAELYRLHGEPESALVDCKKAAFLPSAPPLLYFVQGKTYFDLKRYSEAKLAFDRFIDANPGAGEAYVFRARTDAQMNDWASAEINYSNALQILTAPQPDYYVERAQAQKQQKKVIEAIAGLNDGIQRLGSIPQLELPAIDLEIELKRFDSALRRVDKLASQSPRKEAWLVRKAEILVTADRRSDAENVLNEALKQIELLPAGRRQSSSAIETKVRSELLHLQDLTKQQTKR